MKFLVVDDEQDVEMLFRQRFRKEVRQGLVEMEFAFSGEEALNLLQSKEPHRMLYTFFPISICPECQDWNYLKK